jgi:hypothetical protein
VDDLEFLIIEANDEGAVTEVIRPAAVLPVESARRVVVEMALHDVKGGGLWESEPTLWRRYDRPWASPAEPGDAEVVGTMQVAYGTPTRYEITIYRATVTHAGSRANWTVELLCDEALGFGGYTLATCPRADLKPPPPVFRF